MSGRLSADEIAALGGRLPLWRVSADALALERDFKFPDFMSAFDFMTEVAASAEVMDHHPDWSNSYDKVSIRLTTHSAGGLTDKDVQLAEAADRAALPHQGV
ncbi:MAG: 4a-hydroxytetrahydrobiopterin dehydratase [Asticcacaulis sp.]